MGNDVKTDFVAPSSVYITASEGIWIASVVRSARSCAQFYSRFRNRCMINMRCKGAADEIVEGKGGLHMS